MKISLKKACLRRQGFTLIELLVVIAIIGILASVVLASLNTARSKGSNAKTKAQLSGARAGAEIYYDNNGGYGAANALCTDASAFIRPYTLNTNYPGSLTLSCFSSATAYAMSYPLTVAEGANTNWCIDSTGASKGTAAAASTTVCP